MACYDIPESLILLGAFEETLATVTMPKTSMEKPMDVAEDDLLMRVEIMNAKPTLIIKIE